MLINIPRHDSDDSGAQNWFCKWTCAQNVAALSFVFDQSVTFSPTNLIVSGSSESTANDQETGTKSDTSYSRNEGEIPEFFKRFLVPWESSADGNGKYPPLILVLILVPPMACLLCDWSSSSFSYTVSKHFHLWVHQPLWKAAGYKDLSVENKEHRTTDAR